MTSIHPEPSLDCGRPAQQKGDAATSGAQPIAPELGHTPSDLQQALLPKPNQINYQHPIGPWQRRYTVGLVAVIAALLSADQNLLAPNLSAAAAFFHLDDSQKDVILGGYLMAAFFLVGAPAALLCGFFTDKYNRIHLLAFVVVVGEAPCLCTYWVTELWQFFLVRMLTGVSIGGCFPLVFSLLGDLFPASQRVAMSSIVQIAIGGGIGAGQMLAGLLGPATNWRLPFLVMAAPTLLLALLLVLTTREPPRGGFEKALEGQLAAGAAYSESITWTKVWRLLRVSSNWLIILQGIFGCLPWGVMQTYINDYLHLQKGLSVELATTVILLFGLGSAAGVVAGGAAGQALYNWRRPTMAVLTGTSVLLGAAPVLFLINADIQAVGLGAALVMSALAGFLVSIAGPNLRAIMINVNTPETRGVALALQSVTDDLGKGLGPVIVAGFISRLGRTGAFNLSVSAWFPCGLLLVSLACTMCHDEDAMQQHLAQQSAQILQRVQVDPAQGPNRPSDDPGSTGGAVAQPALEPGTSSTHAGSGLLSRLRVPPVLRSVQRACSPGDGSTQGLAGASGAVRGAVMGLGWQMPATAVAAPSQESGSVEIQQLLAGTPGLSSSQHYQQDQQQRLHGEVPMQERFEEQPGALTVAQAPMGQQQPEQESLHHVGTASLGNSSDDLTMLLQHASHVDCTTHVTATISAVGASHRAGHWPKLRGGRVGTSGRSSSSCATANKSSTSIGLGEGVEQTCTGVGWQGHNVGSKQGLLA